MLRTYILMLIDYGMFSNDESVTREGDSSFLYLENDKCSPLPPL